MATYSSSAECAAFAEWGTLSTSTNPSTTTVDGWRASAYDMICLYTGGAADNSRGTFKQIEMELVSIKFLNIKNEGNDKPTNYLMELSQSQIERLQAAAAIGFGWSSWEPGKDEINVR